MQTPVGAQPRIAMLLDAGADADPHRLFRLLALAEELCLRACVVTLLCREDLPAWAETQVAARGLQVVRHDPQGDDTVAAVRRLEADGVIVDSCRLDAEQYAALRDAGTATLAFSCPDAREPAADLLVDDGADDPDRPGRTRGPVRLTGAVHLLLRNDVLANRPIAAPRHGSPDVPAVTVMAGTLSPPQVALVARLLAETRHPFTATFVTADPEARRAVRSAALQPGQSVGTRPADIRLHERLARSDVLLGVADTEAYEWLCLALPVALVWAEDHQVELYRRLMVRRAVVGLGGLAGLEGDLATAVDRLARLLTDPGERSRLASTAWSLVDGQGRVRVVDALLGHVHRSRGERGG